MLTVIPRDVRHLSTLAFRIVEAQHRIATLKLVDTAAEHEVLESLVERSKPQKDAVGSHGLHYLLATPFRYPPLRHGSRFGRRDQRGLWYGAESVRTTLAEAAYYRLLFLAGTAARIDDAVSEHTVFAVPLATPCGVDLTRGRFRTQRAQLASPTDYAVTQSLGTAMRDLGVEVFRTPSARDNESGVNVGVFTPRAFRARLPRGQQTWHCTTTRQRVVFVRRDVLRNDTLEFHRAQFLVQGRLPSPAL